jgi:hypothetical protein
VKEIQLAERVCGFVDHAPASAEMGLRRHKYINPDKINIHFIWVDFNEETKMSKSQVFTKNIVISSGCHQSERSWPSDADALR